MSPYLDIPIIYPSNQAATGNVIRATTTPENLDAFARKRFSQPQTIFDSKQLADNQPLFWHEKERSGGGTSTVHSPNKAATTMTVTPATPGNRTRQTRRWFNYQPGKSQLINITGVIGAQLNRLSLVVRSNVTGSPVDKVIPQSQWNLDTMDGNGPSGITLNPYKSQIFFFDFEWLGVGTVAYGFFVDRQPIYVHYEHNANVNETVYMSNPNLPLRYEISTDGTTITKRMGLFNDKDGLFLQAQGANGINADLVHICSTVITEGGRQETGLVRGINRGTSSLVTLADNDIYPIIGFRLDPDNLTAFVKLLSSRVICTSQATYAFYVKINPTVVGTTPTWLPLTNSAVEYCFPTNATKVTGGTDVFTDLAVDTNQVTNGSDFSADSDLTIGSDIDGVPDTCFLCVQVLVGTTETFYAAFNFSETN